MLKTTHLLIVLLVSILLIQSSFAKDGAKNAKKEAKPTTAPTHSSNKEVGEVVGNVIELISEYSLQACAKGSQFSKQASTYLNEVTQPYSTEIHDYLSLAADQYLDEKFAKLAKQWLNIYGIFLFSLIAFLIGFMVPNLGWILSVPVLQPFLATFGLGAYGTLSALSQVIGDPILLIGKASKASLVNWNYAVIGLIGLIAVVNFWGLISQDRKKSSSVSLLLSLVLYLDHIHALEKCFPPIGTPYALEVVAFFWLTFISFGRRERTQRAHTTVRKVTIKPEFQTKPKEETKAEEPASSQDKKDKDHKDKAQKRKNRKN